MGKRANGEGSIRKRADGLFEWRYTDGHDPKTGKQRQRSVYGRTQTEVIAKRRAILAELEKTGKVVNPSSITLEKFLLEWLDTYCKNLKPRTVETYRGMIEGRIIPALGQAKLKNLSKKDIQEFINTISGEMKPHSVKNVDGVLHRALQTAVELEYIKVNPADNIQLPKDIKPEMRTVPEGDVEAFLRLFEGDFFLPVVQLAIYTGLRQAELLGLSWDNVDVEHKTLTVRQQLALVTGQGYQLTSPKHDKVRTVQLTSQALQVLTDQKRRQEEWKRNSYKLFNNPWNLVFTNELGKHISRNTLKAHWYKAIKGTDFEGLRFHDLRHSFATYMLRAGVDYKALSDLLGHASVNFTMSTYAHVTAELQRDSADKLEAFFNNLGL